MSPTQQDQLTLKLSAYERSYGISNEQGHSFIHSFVRLFKQKLEAT